MSSESFVGLGALVLLPALLPLAVAAAGVGVAGAAVYGATKAAKAGYDEHKRKLVERYGLEKERLEALDQAVEDIAHARESLATRIRQQVIKERQDKVKTSSFGHLTASSVDSLASDGGVEVLDKKNIGEASQVSDTIDFTDLFLSDTEASEKEPRTIEEYIQIARQRISGLVAFTSEERGAQERLLQRLEDLSEADLTLSDIRVSTEWQIEDLCRRLAEGDGERRRLAYLDYIAVCGLTKTKPRELTYEATLSAAEELAETYIKSQVQTDLFEAVEESLAEVGLEDAGVVVFNDEEGRLVIDRNDATCGIFLRKSDDNESFLFTTVSAQDPLAVGIEEKQQILASAKRLCEKKSQLFEEILPGKGMSVNVEYELDPESLDYIRRMPQLSEYAKTIQSQKSSSTTFGKEVKVQEE